MKHFIMGIVQVGLLFTLVSCGKGSDSKKSSSSSQYKSGECGDKVKEDYNEMYLECQYVTAYNKSGCERELESFINKYPGINCGGEGDEGYIHLTEAELREALEQVRNL